MKARPCRNSSATIADAYTRLSTLSLRSERSLHTSPICRAPTALKEKTDKNAKLAAPTSTPEALTPEQRLQLAKDRAAQKRAQEKIDQERNFRYGALAPTSLFGRDLVDKDKTAVEDNPFEDRNPENMAIALNPRPTARSRWQRRMVIRDVRRRGRPNKEMRIARSERSHLSRSYFFKTSMKKLAPLARQIAGKPIDEAILQMRFSKKKVAKEVHEHLLQARNEAIVMKGMGLGAVSASEDAIVGQDPSQTRALPTQRPSKALKKGVNPNETDIYVAEAWTNKGPYGMEPEFRARGRVNMLRPPNTGISVVLKEEKTRSRQQAEKEVKALRKRMGKNMWVHLPDRKITAQRQHLLW
ncbi:ribosomal protein L22/L17 [Exophiala viscosa]|uniref:Ribosomal protein L22/L17 n=1 Tax=Exophiala viscosa TaxID=2486360 RepID=A0AAN6DUU6_9EURO|nr:ribosomal protein L22/L17 [Exophiala viscosa]